MNPILFHLSRAALVAWAKSGKAPGYLYQAVEKFGSRIQEPRIFDRHLFNGMTIQCDLRDHVQQQIYFFGGYEPIEASLFLSLIKPGDTVLDIGANVGFYSLLLSKKVGEGGKVFSFEPVPKNFLQLQKNIEKSGSPKNIFLNQIAIWDQREQLKFSLGNQHDKNCGGFSAGEVENSIESFECSAMPLTEFVAKDQVGKVSAIKMDIEGAEWRALKGALAIITRDRPILLLEVCKATCSSFGYHPDELWKLFQPLNYSAYKIGATQSLSSWVEDFSQIQQANVLLIPQERKNEVPAQWEDKNLRKGFLAYS